MNWQAERLGREETLLVESSLSLPNLCAEILPLVNQNRTIFGDVIVNEVINLKRSCQGRS